MYEQIERFFNMFEQSALILFIISILFLMTGLIILYYRRKYSLQLKKERKRHENTEKVLRSRLGTLENILNQLPDPAAYRNGRGEFEWVNKEMAALWGFPAGRIVQSRPEDLFPDWSDDLKAIESSLTSRNHPLVKEKRIIDPSGEPRSFEVIYSRMEEPDGSRSGTLFLYKDISHYREQLDILNDLYVSIREDLQQRSDYYAEFLKSGMPPMHQIMEESEKLLHLSSLDSVTKKSIEKIAASGQDMSSYIRNLSFLAFPDKISALYELNESSGGNETLSLEDWQNYLVQRVKDLQGNKDMPVFVLLQGDIPEVLDTRFSLLNELLERLLENADTHSTGGYYLIIKVNRVEAEFFTMYITVRNTGPAIDSARREDIFRPFTRIITEGRGSGLGLTVARSLAEKMGGSLSCDPSCSDGARFLLSLPPVRGRGTVISGTRLDGNKGSGKRSILLADPDNQITQKLAGQFVRTGFSVDQAGSSGEAESLLRNGTYAFVLADSGILSGSDIHERWQKGQYPNVSSLICLRSADMKSNDTEESSFLPQIEKPVDWNQLLDLLIRKEDSSPVSSEE